MRLSTKTRSRSNVLLTNMYKQSTLAWIIAQYLDVIAQYMDSLNCCAMPRRYCENLAGEPGVAWGLSRCNEVLPLARRRVQCPLDAILVVVRCRWGSGVMRTWKGITQNVWQLKVQISILLRSKLQYKSPIIREILYSLSHSPPQREVDE